MKHIIRAGLLPLLLVWCLTGAMLPAAAAGTYTVTSTLDDGSAGTLRNAIAQANADPGATIVFGPGVSGVIALQGAELEIAASMTIVGPGAGVVQVDGGGDFRVFTILLPSAQVGISNLAVQNGSADTDPNLVTNGAGGGIYNGGALTLTGCTLSGNAASFGGGIYNGGALTLTGCTVSGNAAAEGAGGGIYSTGMVTLTGCTLSDNSAFYAGGVYNGSTGTATNCTVSSNSAAASIDGNSGSGAGLYNDGALTLTGCVISGNTAYGGTADNGGSGGSGGGLYSDGTLTLTGCTVSGNTATPNADSSGGLGGGLDNQGAAMLVNDIFYDDTAAAGAEIDNDILDSPSATVTAAYCDIQGLRSLQGISADGTDFDADPLFVAAPADLHLQGESPAIGRGTAAPAGTTDRDGNLRPNPPSVGAYEYTSVGLASLTFASPAAGGIVVTATVTLNGTAPTTMVVGLSSSDPSVVHFHRAVIVPAGASRVTFPITTYPSHVTKTVTIRASLGQVVLTTPGQTVVTTPLTITGD